MDEMTAKSGASPSSEATDSSPAPNVASAPQPGDKITRVTVSECVYVWKLDEYDVGDWYAHGNGPKIVYEYPKWKDVPGVD